MHTIKHIEPWLHWTAENFLSSDCLAELKAVDHSRHQQTDGKRVGGNRIFIDHDNKDQFPHLYGLWQSLHNGSMKEYFEQHTGINYTDLHPRIEVISDIGDFYLEPHHDLLEKRLTALVYTDHERLWPGTQLSDSYRVEAKDNLCMFFVPSTDTWHSYPKTHFDCVRRALQINYWTYTVPRQ
jgi:hypothetical protein